jgi:hypothetical protein
MNLSREFENIDILIAHHTPTTGVDCLSLSMIKMERQMRRLFTYSIYQFPCFSDADIPALRNALFRQGRAYFEGFIRGFDTLHPKSVKLLVGGEHDRLWTEISTAIEYRNKIFHGQLTSASLSTSQLLDKVESIRSWCAKLGNASEEYISYAGFDDSFKKAPNRDFVSGYRTPISSIADYETFLHQHVRRP